ncbi:uncharacterized protein LOC129799274 [Phlebotomus papatasi]|uniref:uncharacterized protein LOC129799274 n=1 Tax=Phlebotomus papatasi TaxID=29031 RepID=UPI0024845F83|nr:uncharacterized protein LOC129799274 [Phlebotomus papatasi]
MGGCRCAFQTCENNSANSPNMHFFHFPAKKMELCKTWAKFANRIDFLSLPLDKLKNKVVCQSHFKKNCFMNYLQNSLVKTAYPTLMRFGDVVIDLESDSSDDIQAKLQAKGLYSVDLHVPDEMLDKDAEGTQDTFVIDMLQSNEEDINVAPGENLMISGVARAPSSQPNFIFEVLEDKRISPKKDMKEVKEPTILNATYNKVIRAKGPTQNVGCVTKRTPRKAVVLSEVALTPRQEVLKESKSKQEAMRPDTTETIELVHEELMQQQPMETEDNAKDQALESMAKEIGDLKQMVLETMTTLKAQSPVTSAQKNPPASESSSAGNGGKVEKNMNKLQLFNAIKRYLNPSMVALLRMEMFGGMDREWKDDEKEFSVELYNLGLNVYEFMRDEWRFRLPPEKTVKEWANEM